MQAWLPLGREFRPLFFSLFAKLPFISFWLTGVCVSHILEKKQGWLEYSRKCLNFMKRLNKQIKLETNVVALAI